MARKAPASKKSVKSAVVSKQKATGSQPKLAVKPAIPLVNPVETAPIVPPKPEISLSERKIQILKARFGKSEKMNSEKQINGALLLRQIELLEEIRDVLNRSDSR